MSCGAVAGWRAAGIDEDAALQDDVDGERHDDRRHAEERDAGAVDRADGSARGEDDAGSPR